MRVLLLLLVCVVASGAQERAQPRSVDVAGCVQAGVEAGCVMLVTAEGHKYHLLAEKEKLPPLGRFVQVKGMAGVDVITFCMEGEPLQVKAVKVLEKKCPKAGGAEEK